MLDYLWPFYWAHSQTVFPRSPEVLSQTAGEEQLPGLASVFEMGPYLRLSSDNEQEEGDDGETRLHLDHP